MHVEGKSTYRLSLHWRLFLSRLFNTTMHEARIVAVKPETTTSKLPECSFLLEETPQQCQEQGISFTIRTNLWRCSGAS